MDASERDIDVTTTFDDRIDKTIERDDNVVLTCVNHPELRWVTKNLGSFVGARGIHFRGTGSYASLFEGVEECPCSRDDLRII